MDRAKRGASFAQHVASYVHRRESKSGGLGAGFGFQYRNRFDPPKNVTTPFRFLDASYKRFDGQDVCYYQFYRHFVAGKNRSFICSRVWEENDVGDIYSVGGDCLGCDEIEVGNKGVSRQLLNAFHGLHLIYFHLAPEEDRTGKIRTTKEGKPIMGLIPCKGRACELCRKKLPRTFGKSVYYPIGTGHLKNISGFAEEIEKSCRCGGALFPVTYSCHKCGSVLLDVSDSELDDEKLALWAQRTHKCPDCNHTDLVVPELECADCNEPSPLSIFDVTLEIKKVGEKAQSTVQIPRWAPTALPEELAKLPIPDLSKVLAGTDTEYQAKCLGVENVYKSRNASKHAEEYEETDRYSDDVPF